MTSDIPTRIYRQIMERSRQFWTNEVGERPFSVVVSGAVEEVIKAERAAAEKEIERLREEIAELLAGADADAYEIERLRADRDGYRAVAENVQRENENLSSGIRDMHASYGLLLKDDSRHRGELARLKLALVSIAKSACCEGCQEAARVAREALGQ